MPTDVDLTVEATFLDPHPGFMGAAIPIPEPVRLAANDLAGRTMRLADAIAALKAVTDGEVWAVAQYRYIGLRIKEPSGREHHFRVIRYLEKTG
jgi:hypothetical protein